MQKCIKLKLCIKNTDIFHLTTIWNCPNCGAKPMQMTTRLQTLQKLDHSWEKSGKVQLKSESATPHFHTQIASLVDVHFFLARSTSQAWVWVPLWAGSWNWCNEMTLTYPGWRASFYTVVMCRLCLLAKEKISLHFWGPSKLLVHWSHSRFDKF